MVLIKKHSEVEKLEYSNSTSCFSETTYLNYDNEIITVVDSDCDLTCSNEKNIWFTNKDVEVNGNDINITYHSADFSGNIDIKLQKISRETGLVDEEHTISSSIGSKTIKSEIYSGFDLTDASGLNIYLEASDGDKDDNYVYRVISQDTPKAFLSINTSYPKIDSLIKTYLKQYVDYVSNVNDAELIISVGRFTDEFKQVNTFSLGPVAWRYWSGWGIYFGGISAHGKREYATYGGLVGRTSYQQPKPAAVAYGNTVIGDIAAVKKLISAREKVFSNLDTIEIEPILIDKYDRTGLSTHNLLKEYTNYSSPQFLKAVDKLLFNNIYDVSIRPVKTLSTTSYDNYTILRVKNLNSDYTQEYREAISETDKPVVLAGGIFSELESWEEDDGLALELAEDGRDTWEIEITGGPNSDCTGKDVDNCPDYTYNDLVDYYWPALVGGIEAYTGKNSIDYIGHSNGCRVALSSINDYSVSGKNNAGYYFNYDTGQYVYSNLSSDVVDTFVGIACPGAFEGQSFFKEYMVKYGDIMLDYIYDKHFTQKELGEKLLVQCYLGETDERSRKICNYLATKVLINDGPRISKNFSKDYLEIMKNEEDQQPVDNGLEINRFKLFYGNISEDPTTGLFLFFLIGDYPYYYAHDGLSTVEDNNNIANNIVSLNNDKTDVSSNIPHDKFQTDYFVKNEIRGFLKNE